MGFEIPLDSDYIDHPKTQHLLKLIGPEADIYPIRLWMWASKYARDGQVRAGWRGVEAACRWRGRPKRLSRALVKAGFLEVRNEVTKTGDLVIHDWMNGVGRAISLYERKKQKQREKYRESVGLPPEDLQDSSDRQTEDHRQSSPNPSNPSDPVNPDNPSNPADGGGGVLRSGSVAAQIASAYLNMNRGVISQQKATELVQFRLDGGMNAEMGLSRVMNQSICKGQKLWDLLDPITPNGEPVTETMKEYRARRDSKKESDAKFGGEDVQT